MWVFFTSFTFVFKSCETFFLTFLQMLKRKDRRDNRATVKMQHELLGKSTVDSDKKGAG